jgi:hypothetical protein
MSVVMNVFTYSVSGYFSYFIRRNRLIFFMSVFLSVE